MERCIYLGKNIYASLVKLDFGEEQKIRLAGRERKLICYECGKPVIYKRGEIRDAHFSHLENDACEYELYSKQCGKKSPSWRAVKEIIYYQLSNQYPNAVIERDERLFKGHYTDFYVEFCGTRLAIEIDDKTMTSKKLTDLVTKMTELKIKVDWIVLDSVRAFHYDHQSYYIKRARLNESVNNTVIVVDKTDFTFCIYKLDTNQYVYSNQYECQFKENVFSYPFDFERLRINEQGLYVEGFDESYQKWLDQRVSEFKQRDEQLIKRNPWNEDHYIELINRIVAGEENLIEQIVSRLSDPHYKNESVLLDVLYNQFKDLNLLDYLPVFESIISKMKETQL